MIKDNDFVNILKDEYDSTFKNPEPTNCIIDSFNPKVLSFNVRTYFNNFDPKNPAFDMILSNKDEVYFISLRIKDGSIYNHQLPDLKDSAPKIEKSIFTDIDGNTAKEKFKKFYELIESYLSKRTNILHRYSYGAYYTRSIRNGKGANHTYKSYHDKLVEKNAPYFLKGIKHIGPNRVMSRTAFYTCLDHTNINKDDLYWLKHHGFTLVRTFYPNRRKKRITTIIKDAHHEFNKFNNK